MLIMMIMIHRRCWWCWLCWLCVYGDVAQDVGDHLGGDRAQRADNAEEEYNRLDGDCRPYRFCLSALVTRLFTFPSWWPGMACGWRKYWWLFIKKLTKLKTLLAMAAMEDCLVWLHSRTGYYTFPISTVHEFVKLVLIKTLKLIKTLEIHFI